MYDEAMFLPSRFVCHGPETSLHLLNMLAESELKARHRIAHPCRVHENLHKLLDSLRRLMDGVFLDQRYHKSAHDSRIGSRSHVPQPVFTASV